MKREEAKAVLYEWQEMMVRNGVPIDTSKVQALRMAIESLQADRPHGEWIYHIDDLFPTESTQECSNCNKHQPININDDDFCPACGADMRKEAEVGHKPDYSYEAGMVRRLVEETLKNKLQELAQWDDYEMAHRKADKLLCDFITKLGYGEVAQKFDAVPKWYA